MKTKTILKAGIKDMSYCINAGEAEENITHGNYHLLKAIAIYFKTSLEVELDDLVD